MANKLSQSALMSFIYLLVAWKLKLSIQVLQLMMGKKNNNSKRAMINKENKTNKIRLQMKQKTFKTTPMIKLRRKLVIKTRKVKLRMLTVLICQ